MSHDRSEEAVIVVFWTAVLLVSVVLLALAWWNAGRQRRRVDQRRVRDGQDHIWGKELGSLRRAHPDDFR